VLIYPQERHDGIAKLIGDSGKVTYASLVEHNPDFAGDVSSLKNKLATASNTTPDTIDLFPVKDILVSTGWNLNDDVFSKDEVWGARFSSVDKPINKDHIPNQIVGHIISAVPVDVEGKVVSTDSIEDAPEKMDILNESVLYTFLNTEFETTMAETLEEIKKGEWCVSMEAIFTNFDYAVADMDGSNKIIPRNNNTAFLSKHLKAYGGTGSYNGAKIGRLLKNIFFSGKALTKNPANPRSIIINDYTKASVSTIENLKGNQMEEELKLLKARVGELEAQLAAKQAEIVNASNALNSKNSEFTTLMANHEGLQKQFNELTTKLADTETQIATFKSKLDEIQKEKLQATRAAQILAKGYEKTQAEEYVNHFMELADDKWEIFVNALATITKVETKVEEVVVTPPPVDKTDATKLEEVEEVVEGEEEKKKAEAAAKEAEEKNKKIDSLSVDVANYLSKNAKKNKTENK
jgi:hypothetical protein